MGLLSDIFGVGVDPRFSAAEPGVNYEPDPNAMDNTDYDSNPNGLKKTTHSIENNKASNIDEVGEERSNDIKMMKFKKMIEDIEKDIVPIGRSSVLISEPEEIYYLALIYDYNALNEYGKFIMRQCDEDINSLCQLYKDDEKKMGVAWKFIDEQDEIASRKFVFWAILMLTVDSTNKEEHLSLICDFAMALEISDEEMLDIIKVIQIIYDSAEDEIEFHSKSIPSYFRRLFGGYNYSSEVEHYPSYYNSNISFIADEEIKIWEKYD